MKDGTVYKGKILFDNDKALIIGNPPFDPNSYFLKSEDIEKVIHEEYHLSPPAERKRGLIALWRLGGNMSSSDQLSLKPTESVYAGLGFRVHPLLELDGGLTWEPSLQTKDPLSVSDGTTTRYYQNFWEYHAGFSARFYPFYQKLWKTEPYLTTGYSWSRLTPKDSGDYLKGSGWNIGIGAIRPLTTHLFLETQFIYEQISYDTIQYLGQSGTLQPSIDRHRFELSVGASYRL